MVQPSSKSKFDLHGGKMDITYLLTSVFALRFKEKYTSYGYGSSHCPVVCTYADNKIEQQKYCQDKWWNVKSRYCPENTKGHENAACQVSRPLYSVKSSINYYAEHTGLTCARSRAGLHKISVITG